MSIRAFPGVVLPGHEHETVTIHVADGVIGAITPSHGPSQWMALPPLADLHLHACRAYTLAGPPPRDFADAVAIATRRAGELDVTDYRTAATRMFAAAARHGTARSRTHADVGRAVGMRALEGTLRAREDCAGALAIEIVAFAGGDDDPATATGRTMLADSVRAGADLIGAVPNFYPDPARSIDGLLDLALLLDCEVDMHLDEHLDPTRVWSAYLAAAVTARNMGDRVALSHGCAIGVLPDAERRRAIDTIAAAGLTVIALPATNLYLQDRGQRSPRERGLTAVRELIAAGVPVRVASDNVNDVFYPFGSGDMLEIAWLTALAAHVEAPEVLVPLICDGRRALTVGDPADFLLVDAISFTDLLARRSDRRIRIRAGIAEDDCPYRDHDI